MTRSLIRISVVTRKIEIVRRMLAGISTLPLASRLEFLEDPRMVAAGESFLRRALEALFDLGRHILAKGFAVAASEYKSIPPALLQEGIIGVELAESLTEMAGYRNRLVHFYDEVSSEELFEILKHRLGDIESVLTAIQAWMEERSELFDTSL